MNPHDEQKLERLIHQTLRDLPPRRAPQSLEMRVLAAIEQSAALPWWRKSFPYWPLPARVAFLLLSAAIVGAIYRLASGAEGIALSDSLMPRFAWVDSIMALVAATAEFSRVVVRSIPPLWLYGGLAFVAALYAALFGLGAAAYRTLYASR